MPPVRSRIVRRDRIIRQLELAPSPVLTLLSAPPGYGKTTLLIDWLRSPSMEAGRSPAVAWVSLDESDNDPTRFLRVLVTALRTAFPSIGETVLTHIPRLPPFDRLLTRLVNELAAAPREIVLVLEDYHVIHQPVIQRAVAFLLEHFPPCVRLAIATREDPALPLAQLRARGALCELRMADLRFTADETDTFLRDVMQLSLSTAQATALAARTEGWVAGLQLAALSLPGQDVSGVIGTLGRNHRHILDYLKTEVLNRQPVPVQTFLLRTAVLEQLTSSLCEAVVGRENMPDGGAQAMLERIERANLFLVPLDPERNWYRYHQVFAEILRVQLHQTDPSLALSLHRRAGEWYEQQGFVPEAIQHAVAAADFDWAARLVEQHGMAFLVSGQVQTVLGWLGGLPTELAQARPRLCLIRAYACFVLNEGDTAETYLKFAEAHLPSDLALEEVAFVQGRVVLIRALLARDTGDLPRGVALAAQALNLLPISDFDGRALARVQIARAFVISGDVTPATEHEVAAVAEQAKAARLPTAARIGLALLGRLYVMQGRLRRAAAVFAEAERALGLGVTPGMFTYYFGFGDLLREWNDLDRAEALLTQGVDFITAGHSVATDMAMQGYIALARLREARGDSRGALAALDAFTHLARERNMIAPVLARAAAVRAHLWLLQGNTVAASRWAETSGLGPDDRVGYAREPEYLVLARVLIARRSEAAQPLLDRLMADAEAGGRLGSVIEIEMLRALGQHALGNEAGALAALERGLRLGEPEGYVRLFVDEGGPMAALLRGAQARGIAPEYTARLLAAFPDNVGEMSGSDIAQQDEPTGAARASEPPDVLVETLTRREREILKLIGTGASNQDIAQALVLTRDTIKKHVYHIFGKLGVRNRIQAVVKGQVLNRH